MAPVGIDSWELFPGLLQSQQPFYPKHFVCILKPSLPLTLTTKRGHSVAISRRRRHSLSYFHRATLPSFAAGRVVVVLEFQVAIR